MIEKILGAQPSFFNRDHGKDRRQPARKQHGEELFENFLKEAMKDGEDQKKREPKHLRRL